MKAKRIAVAILSLLFIGFLVLCTYSPLQPAAVSSGVGSQTAAPAAEPAAAETASSGPKLELPSLITPKVTLTGGSFPVLEYRFGESAFRDGEDRPAVEYARLMRLVADDEYLYLFVSKASGYMIERASVQGEGGGDGLMRLLADRSGLRWRRPFSLLTFRLRDLWG